MLARQALVKWFHLSVNLSVSLIRYMKAKTTTHVLVSPYSIAGALMLCFPPLQRLHLKRSCVCSARRLISTHTQVGTARETHLASRLLVLEQLTKVVARVVALDVLLGVDDTRGQVLLVRLTLEDCRTSARGSASVPMSLEAIPAHSSPRPCPSRRSGRRSLHGKEGEGQQ